MLPTQLNTNQSFLRLEDLLLSPPLPAIISILIVLGILNLAVRARGWLKIERKSALELAAVFVVTTGILSALVHALAWSGHASIPILRFGAWLLAAFGLMGIGKLYAGNVARTAAEYWRAGSRVERFALIVSLVTLTGLFAAALGPAVDADSMEYHLGVPLDWLRHGGAYPRPDWFTARYVGLGESLNMLGLAAGTDGLGAAFQAAGLIVAILGVTAFAKNRDGSDFCYPARCYVPNHRSLDCRSEVTAVACGWLNRGAGYSHPAFQEYSIYLPPSCLRLHGFRNGKQALVLAYGQCGRVFGLVAAVRAQRLGWPSWCWESVLQCLLHLCSHGTLSFTETPSRRCLNGGDRAAIRLVIAYAQRSLRD